LKENLIDEESTLYEEHINGNTKIFSLRTGFADILCKTGLELFLKNKMRVWTGALLLLALAVDASTWKCARTACDLLDVRNLNTKDIPRNTTEM
jgi:hypothetical protein